MKKNRIGDIILWLVVIVVVFNTIIAYVSYKNVSDKKEPKLSFGVSEKKGKVIYKEGLYNVIVSEDEKTRTVSLKLFFLK